VASKVEMSSLAIAFIFTVLGVVSAALAASHCK
jgi:hypothetical protein